MPISIQKTRPSADNILFMQKSGDLYAGFCILEGNHDSQDIADLKNEFNKIKDIDDFDLFIKFYNKVVHTNMYVSHIIVGKKDEIEIEFLGNEFTGVYVTTVHVGPIVNKYAQRGDLVCIPVAGEKMGLFYIVGGSYYGSRGGTLAGVSNAWRVAQVNVDGTLGKTEPYNYQNMFDYLQGHEVVIDCIHTDPEMKYGE